MTSCCEIGSQRTPTLMSVVIVTSQFRHSPASHFQFFSLYSVTSSLWSGFSGLDSRFSRKVAEECSCLKLKRKIFIIVMFFRFFVVLGLACHLPVLDGFDWHFQASVHLTLSSAPATSKNRFFRFFRFPDSSSLRNVIISIYFLHNSLNECGWDCV